MAHHEPKVQFAYDDYTETHWDECVLLLASRRSIAFYLNAVRVASYYNTRWSDANGHNLNDEQLSIVRGWVEQSVKELIMSCEITEILQQIATSLESINIKLDTLEVTVPSNGLGPYLDEIEEMLQPLPLLIGGINVPIETGGE